MCDWLFPPLALFMPLRLHSCLLSKSTLPFGCPEYSQFSSSPIVCRAFTYALHLACVLVLTFHSERPVGWWHLLTQMWWLALRSLSHLLLLCFTLWKSRIAKHTIPQTPYSWGSGVIPPGQLGVFVVWRDHHSPPHPLQFLLEHWMKPWVFVPNSGHWKAKHGTSVSLLEWCSYKSRGVRGSSFLNPTLDSGDTGSRARVLLVAPGFSAFPMVGEEASLLVSHSRCPSGANPFQRLTLPSPSSFSILSSSTLAGITAHLLRVSDLIPNLEIAELNS